MVTAIYQDVFMDSASIAARLLEARKASGLSQVQLSWALGTGQSTIGTRERNTQQATLRKLGEYAKVLQISPVWLVCGVGHITDEYTIGIQGKITMPMNYSTVASFDNASVLSRLLFAREQSGMSQYTLADAIGVHRNTIWTYESGKTIPMPDKIPALAWAMNVYPLWLATGVGIA